MKCVSARSDAGGSELCLWLLAPGAEHCVGYGVTTLGQKTFVMCLAVF